MPKGSRKRSAEEAVGDVEDALAGTDEENSIVGVKAEDEDGLEASQGDQLSGEQVQSAASDEESGDDKEEEEEEEASKDEKESGNLDQEDEAMENVAEAEDDAADDQNENQEGSPETKFRKINIAGRPAEAGVIKTVYCENFMCHRKLKINLCRNVNFVNGQNGSGKSAILASIQICLGANARRTHRARNLKDLVRKEAAGNNPNTSAKIRVTLLNGGEDAFKPDLYGNEITVERSISLRGGYNGYRLLDVSLKEVSREKKELDTMLDHLNIQVDNPVAILDQEEAKKFLLGKPGDKYNFFMKATELERIDKKYAETSDKAEDLKAKHSSVVSQLEEKHAIAEELKKKYEMHTSVQKLEKKLLEYQIQYCWAFYAERNEEYQDILKKKEGFVQKLQAKQLELTQAEEEVSGANDDDEEARIRQEMDDLRKEATDQAELKRKLESERKLAIVPYKAKERDLKSLKKDKERANKELSRARERLQDARAEILAKAGSAESDEARRTSALADNERLLAEAQEATNRFKQAQATSYQDWEEFSAQVDQAIQVTATKRSQVKAVDHKLGELNSSSGNSLAIFGQKCVKMHQLIEDAKKKGRFQAEVLGPIGAFIKIAPRKEQYAELAEQALGRNILDRFIATNDQDRKLLQRLREQAQCRGKECGLFQVSVNPRYQVPPPPPAEGIETVASALVIDDDIVFNCLVDNARIDQRALAPSKEYSEQKLLKCNNGKYSIEGNIKDVFFLPNGDKWNVMNSAIAIASNEQGLRGRKIGVDKTAAIAETERELAQLQKELKEAETTENDFKKQKHAAQVEWNNAKRSFRDNQDTIELLKSKIDEIRVEIETTATTTIDTTDLEEDVADAEKMVASIAEQESACQKELEALKPAVEEVERNLEEVAARNDKVLKDMETADEKLAACVNRKSQSQSIIQKKRDKLEKIRTVLEKHQERLDEKDSERQKALKQARTLRLKQKIMSEQNDNEGEIQAKPEISDEALEIVAVETVEKSSDDYNAKIGRTKAKIEKEKEKKALSNEDPAAALQKWQNAKKHLKDCQDQAEDLDKTIKTLEADLRDRQRRWRKLRAYLARVTDDRFDDILNLNNSSGNLEFDDETHQLNLVVQKNMHDTNSQTKDVKALSGGERSYTTMSLLLALGESLETPFRILDEFDVFLDTQARKLTIQTLIFVAKKMEHRQFIFITPQDLSSVRSDKKVKIFKLRNPDRNNVAGGPTQQTLDFSQA